MQRLSLVLKGVVEEFAIEPIEPPVVVSNVTMEFADVTL